jgi:hypothetical protein
MKTLENRIINGSVFSSKNFVTVRKRWPEIGCFCQLFTHFYPESKIGSLERVVLIHYSVTHM